MLKCNICCNLGNLRLFFRQVERGRESLRFCGLDHSQTSKPQNIEHEDKQGFPVKSTASCDSAVEQEADIDLATSTELLNQALTLLGPLIEFHKADEEMTMDDIKIRWDVRAIRGSSTPFAHLKGDSTFHKMLAPNMMANASERIEQEMTDKILLPMVAIFQEFVNRVALEDVAAKDAALDPDDLTDADLR